MYHMYHMYHIICTHISLVSYCIIYIIFSSFLLTNPSLPFLPSLLLDPHEPDAFDELVSLPHSPQLLSIATLLTTFTNTHLSPIGIHITSISTQFHDGVYLIMLIGALGGFFIPPYNYVMTPVTMEEKMANVRFAFRMMRGMEVKRNGWDVGGVVRGEVAVTMRVLFALYTAFKHAEE